MPQIPRLQHALRLDVWRLPRLVVRRPPRALPRRLLLGLGPLRRYARRVFSRTKRSHCRPHPCADRPRPVVPPRSVVGFGGVGLL